jgi:hypothetical protein
VALVCDHTRLEAALEEVSAAVVAPVEADRVEAVEALHAGRELRLGRLDQDVEVVVEQVPDVNFPPEARLHLAEELVPGLAVEVVEHDRALLDAAADDVVPGGARQLRTRNPRHQLTVAPGRRERNRPERPSSRDSP